MFWNVATYILFGMVLISSARIILGPSVWDRLLGLSLVSSKIIIIIVIYAYINGSTFYLDIALIMALLGFVGTTSLAAFLRKAK